uniref:MULE domain-containing protein n=1 Tax=Steinernema glaseri TaxID=37863 RepID=A0A1I7Z8R1_9BILA
MSAHRRLLYVLTYCMHTFVYILIQKKDLRETIKTNAQQHLDTASRNIVKEAADQAPLEAIDDREYDSFHRLVRRVRELPERLTVDCASVSNIAISGVYAMTKFSGGSRFLAWDSRVDDPNLPVIFLFLSDQGIRRLRTYPNWCGDGQFTFVPKNLMQLYTVGVLVETHFIPCAFAFMQNRTLHSYQRLFRRISTLTSSFQPASFMSDLELSAQKAVLSVYSNNTTRVQLESCLFHLSQAVFRKLQKHGYTPLYYDNDKSFKKLVRSLPCLAFLPPDLVVPSFFELSNEITSLPPRFTRAACHMFFYFSETYVIRFNASGSPAPPRFPPEIWNCHSLVLSDRPRTNNAIEGWHNSFKSHFGGGANISFSKIIRALQKEESAASLILRGRESDPSRPLFAPARHKKYVIVDKRIKTLVTRFNPNQDVISHLYALQKFLSKASPLINGPDD